MIVLPSSISPAQLARVAADEDADADHRSPPTTAARSRSAASSCARCPTDATVIFGGVLNEDDGGPLPVDARPGLEALGIRCVDEIEQLARRWRGP